MIAIILQIYFVENYYLCFRLESMFRNIKLTLNLSSSTTKRNKKQKKKKTSYGKQ